MEFKINDDVNEIRISHEIIKQMVDMPGVFTIAIEVYKNCSSTKLVEIEIADGSVYFDFDDILLTPDSFDQSEYFDDGVYTLKLVRSVIGEEVKAKIEGCVFADKVLRCRILEYYTTSFDKRVPAYWAALRHFSGCGKCKCDKACVVYNQLLEILNDSDDDCNCESYS